MSTDDKTLSITPPLVLGTAANHAHSAPPIRGRPPKLSKADADTVCYWFALGYSVPKIVHMMAEAGMPTVSEHTAYTWAHEWQQRIMEMSAVRNGYHRIAEAVTPLHRDIYAQRLLELEEKLRTALDDPGRMGTYPRIGPYIKVLELIAKLQGHNAEPARGGQPLTATGAGSAAEPVVLDGEWRHLTLAEVKAMRVALFGESGVAQPQGSMADPEPEPADTAGPT